MNFSFYFNIGLEHIIDGLDHVLFIIALCLHYNFSDWKKLLLLVTAFTVGHSFTLALSVLNVFTLSTTYTEFLIPVTIALTVLYNVFTLNKKNTKPIVLYSVVLLFGLIHGMGFSYLLKSMLGKTSNVVTELLGFNAGLEVGQLAIVTVVLTILFIFVNFIKVQRSLFVLFINGSIFSLALQMAVERYPF